MAGALHDRLTAESGLTAETVKTILEHTKTNVIRELRATRFSVIPNLCTFRHCLIAGRPAREFCIRGHTFKSRPYTETGRVHCTVLKSFEREAVASTQQQRTKKTAHRSKAQTAFCSNVVKSIGDETIKEDTIDDFIAALRSTINQCLRQTGICVLTGLVTFTRKDVKAKPAQYSNKKGSSKIIQAKGPERRVFGRVHV